MELTTNNGIKEPSRSVEPKPNKTANGGRGGLPMKGLLIAMLLLMSLPSWGAVAYSTSGVNGGTATTATVTTSAAAPAGSLLVFAMACTDTAGTVTAPVVSNASPADTLTQVSGSPWATTGLTNNLKVFVYAGVTTAGRSPSIQVSTTVSNCGTWGTVLHVYTGAAASANASTFNYGTVTAGNAGSGNAGAITTAYNSSAIVIFQFERGLSIAGWAPGAGYTARSGASSATIGRHGGDKVSGTGCATVTPTTSWNSGASNVDWGVIAVEVRSSGDSACSAPSPAVFRHKTVIIR